MILNRRYTGGPQVAVWPIGPHGPKVDTRAQDPSCRLANPEGAGIRHKKSKQY